MEKITKTNWAIGYRDYLLGLPGLISKLGLTKSNWLATIHKMLMLSGGPPTGDSKPVTKSNAIRVLRDYMIKEQKFML